MFFQQRRYCTDSVIFSQRNWCTGGILIRLMLYFFMLCEPDPKHLYKCGKLKQLACTWLAKYNSVFIMFISVLNDIGPPPMPAGFLLPSSLFIVLTSNLKSSDSILPPSMVRPAPSLFPLHLLLASSWPICRLVHSCHLKLYMIFACTLLRCSYSETSL